MTSPKYFCVSCEMLQQYNSKECNRCKEPVFGVGRNTRFPKHPKKADYQELCWCVSWDINNSKDKYCSEKREWSFDFQDKLELFFSKHGSTDGQKIIKALLECSPVSASAYTDLKGYKLSKALEEFSKQYGTHNKHPKGVYTASVSVFFPMDNSMSYSMRSEDIDMDFFKSRKTKMVSKGTSTYMVDNPKQFRWDGTTIENHRYFKEILHCQVFVSELQKYILTHIDEFPEFIVRQAENYKSSKTMECYYPEFLI